VRVKRAQSRHGRNLPSRGAFGLALQL
jgi:hypothetical protein